MIVGEKSNYKERKQIKNLKKYFIAAWACCIAFAYIYILWK
jgi:hypothetical protein